MDLTHNMRLRQKHENRPAGCIDRGGGGVEALILDHDVCYCMSFMKRFFYRRMAGKIKRADVAARGDGDIFVGVGNEEPLTAYHECCMVA